MSHYLEAAALDHTGLDLAAADRVTFRLCQTFRYTYETPIESLRHKLVVVPPDRHGEAHLRGHRLIATGATGRHQTSRDATGNTVVRFAADRVEEFVEFQIAVVVERVRADGPPLLPASALSDPRHRLATPLTEPDDALLALAASIVGLPAVGPAPIWPEVVEAAGHVPGVGGLAAGGASADDTLAIADRICAAVHGCLRYGHGVTQVETTAAEALAGGVGVCQDYAHIMVAVCRLVGIPARYVSGHLLGQGGTHAWVEVITPHAGAGAQAIAFDPCHGRRAGAGYVTVATGRDYADVAPTSGSYARGGPGQLTGTRELQVLAVHPAASVAPPAHRT